MQPGPSDDVWQNRLERLRQAGFSGDVRAEAIAALWRWECEHGAEPGDPPAFLLAVAKRREAEECRQASRIRPGGDLIALPAPPAVTEWSFRIGPWPDATTLVHRALILAQAVVSDDRELASTTGLSLPLLRRLEREAVEALGGSMPSAFLEALSSADRARPCEPSRPRLDLRMPPATEPVPDRIVAGRLFAVLRAHGFTLGYLEYLAGASKSTIQRLSARFLPGPCKRGWIFPLKKN